MTGSKKTKTIHVALLGLGIVGNGIYQTIHTYQSRLQTLTGANVHISTIVIEHPDRHTRINENITVTTEINDVLDDPDIEVVFEAIVGKEPAFSYLMQCIKKGKHVITANKEMFANHGTELKALAELHQVSVGYDATTAGGIPIIQTIQQLMQVNKVTKIQAILNGTSNYILTEMRDQNVAFTDALKQAQELGYAEADPANDIEGYDAFYKLMILSELIFDEQPVWEEVNRIGITNVTGDQMRKSQIKGEKIKHIATIYKSAGKIQATVKPISISDDHPLYGVDGVDNAINMEADIVGQLTLRGPGAGALPTASAMMEDFCTIISQRVKNKNTIPV